MLEVINRLDKIASILQDRGLLGIASQIDVVANTIEKTAANRRMREFLLEKLKEWFPDKVKALETAGMPDILRDLIDNIAATYLEIATPGRNKVLDIDELYEFKDKTTGKTQDRPIEYLHLNFFPNKLKELPSFKGLPISFYQEMGRILSRAAVSQSSQETLDRSQLATEQGQPKVNTLEYLFKKMIPEEVTYFDASTKANKTVKINPAVVAKELAVEISKSAATVLIDLFSGQLSRSDSPAYKRMQTTGVKPDFKWTAKGKAEEEERILKEVNSSRYLKEKLTKLMNSVWKGPIHIPLDTQTLSHIIDPKQVDAIFGRIHNIHRSVGYKDEERLVGAQDRVGPFPGPAAPWNTGKELILEESPGSTHYAIREGWHRLMAMVQEVAKTGQTKFTVSAFIVNPPPPEAVKKALKGL